MYQIGKAFRTAKGKSSAVFQCDCGNTCVKRMDAIPTNCGCETKSKQSKAAKSRKPNRRTHGMFGTKIYKIWSSMIQRCGNQKSEAYPHYGGRGITVCEEWKTFERFYADMGAPQKGLTLDRIDNNSGYSKSNCRWATVSQQSRNKRNNVIVTIEGVTRVASDWSKEPGAFGRKAIVRRIRAGIEGRKAVFNE